MKIKFKDTSNRAGQNRTKAMSSIPLSPIPSFHSASHPFINSNSINHSEFQSDLYIKKRPLKPNSQNLSFEGLSVSANKFLYKQANQIAYNIEEVLKVTDKNLGQSHRELFDDLKKSKFAKKMVSFDNNGGVVFNKKTVIHLLYDGIVYPIKILPADILNGIVGALRKIKPLSKWADGVYESPMFKNIRQRSKIDSKVNALRGIFETVDSLTSQYEKSTKKVFESAIKENKFNKRTSDSILMLLEDRKFDEALATADFYGAYPKVTKELVELRENFSSSLLQRSVKTVDSTKGQYDTKHERSLNRVVSGAIPAIFLANDAYNLSSMCENNSKAAEKEKKTRFKQELSRVGLQAYITLVTLGAMQKFINNSKFAIMLSTGLTVLTTEIFSRLSNGKQITRLTPEKAQTLNAKGQGQNEGQKEATVNLKDTQTDYQPIFFRAGDRRKVFASFSGTKAPSFKGFAVPNATKTKTTNKTQEPLLSFNSLLKASAVSIAIGFSLKGLKNIKALDKATGKFKKPVAELLEKISKPFTNMYKKITVEQDHKIPRKQFDQIVDKLEENGFPEIANKYRKIVEENKEALIKKEFVNWLGEYPERLTDRPSKTARDIYNIGLWGTSRKAQGIIKEHTDFVHLGSKNKKIKPFVDFIKAPFGFMLDTVALPYRLVDKAMGMFSKKIPKVPKTMNELNMEAVSKSIESLGKEVLSKNFQPKSFKEYMDLNIQKSFNVDNISNVSNSELANLAKTAATAGTISFLMTDNYNMVMMKSNGKDKEGAELKAKERVVQEGSRFFYQTLLIDLFNKTFSTQYNKSLLGMSVVTAACTGIGEYLTRVSVGVPIGKHSRDEIIEIEKNKEGATGFLKGYYNFMSRLTGKKSLAEQKQAKQAAKG